MERALAVPAIAPHERELRFHPGLAARHIDLDLHNIIKDQPELGRFLASAVQRDSRWQAPAVRRPGIALC